MDTNQFFDESTDSSLAKVNIVSKYFGAWARVILSKNRTPTTRIAYRDLYAGRGCYEDGTKSTPLLVLEQTIGDPLLREHVVTVFNDRSKRNIKRLRQAVFALPGIDTLRHVPQFDTQDVGDRIVAELRQNDLVPTLLFLDPWGYKGLSLSLVNAVLKDWACECVFFFNYNRINPGLDNPSVAQHIDLIFGKPRSDALRAKVRGLAPAEREHAILAELKAALYEAGPRFVLPFRFANETGTRTSHYLIFVTKNIKGYEIMKDVMASASSNCPQGVPSFEYNPARARQPLLFDTSRPLDKLQQMLLDDFAGRCVAVSELYERHSIGKLYVARNYKDALRCLEKAGKIVASPPAEERPMRKGEVTFSDTVVVTFPEKVA